MYIDPNSLVLILIIGAAAGWLAGNIMRRGGFGAVGNIIVGIIGSFLGEWIFRALGISLGRGLVSTLLTAVIGAAVLLFLLGLVRR